MYRFAIESLLQWKEKENRKPLLLMGARQVGKTWLMKEFGKNIMIKLQSLKAYCEKYHPEKAVRLSSKKYIDQGWMENIPLYAVCNL